MERKPARNPIADKAHTKVFCIGFQKTGTSSLRDALTQLGYRVTGVFGRETPLEELKETYVQTGLRIAEEFDAVEDMPWPLMFRELDKAFPGSKFILTTRDIDEWYGSIAGHFGANPYHIQQLTYGEDCPAPVGHEERYREVFEAHNAAVKEYFLGRPEDLLEFSLERGNGWAELCSFLEIEAVPDGPFVHTNSSHQRRGFYYRLRRRLSRYGLPFARMDG
ncbi:MAG: sulfotransferase family protein [Pseudomonadota bacterium]